MKAREIIYRGLAVFESLYFALLYIVPPFKKYNTFQLLNYDYGLYYQATYLLSRFQSLYLTTCGLHLWLAHQIYFSILLAPLHYLPVPHYFLLMAYSFGIWACGLFCMIFFWRSNKSLSLLVPLVVWLSPFMVNMNLDIYHVESFATIFLLLTFLACLKGWKKSFYLFLILAISCKEDVAITAGFFLLLALCRPKFFQLSRREFGCGLALCVSLFLFSETLIVPYYRLKTCQWLDRGFSAHLTGPSPAVPWFTSSHWFANIYQDLRTPSFYKEHFLSREAGRYLLLLFWPVFLFLEGSFPFCLLPLPGALINMVGVVYMFQGYWHYDHSTFAAVMITVLIGLEKTRWKKSLSLILAAITVVISLKFPRVRVRPMELFSRPFWRMEKVPEVRFLETLRKRLPRDVVVSADYNSLNYLLEGHENVYMFPNPLEKNYFGIYGLCEDPVSLPKPDLVILRSGWKIDVRTQALLKGSYEHQRIHDNDTSAEFDVYLLSRSSFHDRLNSIFQTFERSPPECFLTCAIPNGGFELPEETLPL